MTQVEKKQNIFLQTLEWQYLDVPVFILRVWRNYLRFYLNYFSIHLLIRTLFAPWRRYKWSMGRGFDIGRWVEATISNTISRVLGAIMRTSLILVGIIIELFVFISGVFIFVLWLILPFLIIGGFCFGIKIIF